MSRIPSLLTSVVDSMTRRCVIVFAFCGALALSLGASPAESQTEACAEAVTLWNALPAAERSRALRGEGESFDTSRHTAVQGNFDQTPDTESVLSFTPPESFSVDADKTSFVWFFRCAGDVPSYIDGFAFENNSYSNGTLDGEFGIVTARAERFRGLDHLLLRIEHVDIFGGADPRYSIRTFNLLHLVDSHVVSALAVPTMEETIGGPMRDMLCEKQATVTYEAGRVPKLRYRARKLDHTTGRTPRTTRCTTRAVFDGTRFVPDKPGCFTL